MVLRYMKNCSTSLIIMKTQVKMTMRSYLIPFKMNIIEITSSGEDVKREASYTVSGDVNLCSHMKNSMKVSQKIKNRTIIWSSNSHFGYLSKENENTNSKRPMYPSMFTGASFPIPKVWKQPKCPLMDEWTENMWYTKPTTEYHLAIKRMKPCHLW